MSVTLPFQPHLVHFVCGWDISRCLSIVKHVGNAFSLFHLLLTSLHVIRGALARAKSTFLSVLHLTLPQSIFVARQEIVYVSGLLLELLETTEVPKVFLVCCDEVPDRGAAVQLGDGRTFLFILIEMGPPLVLGVLKLRVREDLGLTKLGHAEDQEAEDWE